MQPMLLVIAADEVTRTVNIVNTNASSDSITLSGDNPLTLEYGSTYVEQGASAYGCKL